MYWKLDQNSIICCQFFLPETKFNETRSIFSLQSISILHFYFNFLFAYQILHHHWQTFSYKDSRYRECWTQHHLFFTHSIFTALKTICSSCTQYFLRKQKHKVDSYGFCWFITKKIQSDIQELRHRHIHTHTRDREKWLSSCIRKKFTTKKIYKTETRNASHKHDIWLLIRHTLFHLSCS